ncbi:PREDICTED: THUMP domain-containing protein 1 [Thamnophis sirtalis]|uniref:THUMP domain-containing protein 1 n=1 Tax=Thamnophis sirtalis TaxID=35019 RepID=A0A6I9XP22_9SAUR|nr:PREDICTED: THUMP domain-containing protein 1 [Thamnophis sirtalis]
MAAAAAPIAAAASPMEASVETPPVAKAAPVRRKRKPPKGKYAHLSKRPKVLGPRKLEAGMSGILITSNVGQQKCVAEAYNLLSEYGEQLYGPGEFIEQKVVRLGEEEEDDAEAALKKEVDQIRTSTEQKRRRFQSLPSGANNVFFIRTQGVGMCA